MAIESWQISRGCVSARALHSALLSHTVLTPVSTHLPVAGFIEWLLTYFLIANEEGLCMKEDLRKCYDGSIFFEKTNSKDNHPVIRNDIK